MSFFLEAILDWSRGKLRERDFTDADYIYGGICCTDRYEISDERSVQEIDVADVLDFLQEAHREAPKPLQRQRL